LRTVRKEAAAAAAANKGPYATLDYPAPFQSNLVPNNLFQSNLMAYPALSDVNGKAAWKVELTPYTYNAQLDLRSFHRDAIPDAAKEAESALKALREAPDKEGQRRAAEALDKALKKLREQLK
jgi:hypothetical protein